MDFVIRKTAGFHKKLFIYPTRAYRILLGSISGITEASMTHKGNIKKDDEPPDREMKQTLNLLYVVLPSSSAI